MISNAEQLEEKEVEDIGEDDWKIIASSELSDYIDKIKKYFMTNKVMIAFKVTADEKLRKVLPIILTSNFNIHS